MTSKESRKQRPALSDLTQIQIGESKKYIWQVKCIYNFSSKKDAEKFIKEIES